MKKLNILFGIATFLLVHLSVFPQQSNDNSPFRFEYEGPRNTSNLSEIEFIDTTTKEVINTFSLAEKNLFNHLDYPIKNSPNYSQRYNIYDITNTQLGEVKIPDYSFYYFKPFSPSRILKQATLNSYHSWGVFEDTTLVVKFTAAIQGYDSFFAITNMFYFLDKRGNVISTIDDFSSNIGEFAITGQRHFVCTYGGWGPSPIGVFENFGYLAYDIINNELIDQQEFGNQYQAIGVIGYDGLIRVGLVKNDHSEDVIYFDFEKGKKYIKNLHDSVLFSIRETTRDGIIYLNNGGRDTLYFDKYFKVEDIK